MPAFCSIWASSSEPDDEARLYGRFSFKKNINCMLKKTWFLLGKKNIKKTRHGMWRFPKTS